MWGKTRCKSTFSELFMEAAGTFCGQIILPILQSSYVLSGRVVYITI